MVGRGRDWGHLSLKFICANGFFSSTHTNSETYSNPVRMWHITGRSHTRQVIIFCKLERLLDGEYNLTRLNRVLYHVITQSEDLDRFFAQRHC